MIYIRDSHDPDKNPGTVGSGKHYFAPSPLEGEGWDEGGVMGLPSLRTTRGSVATQLLWLLLCHLELVEGPITPLFISVPRQFIAKTQIRAYV